MAPWVYYDSTSATGWNYTSNASADTSFTYFTGGSTWRVVRRKYLVHAPEHWSDEDVLAFVRLINQDTKTGFLVEMVIKGDVLITDPTIETRTMKDFVPLLRWRASSSDIEKINEFFLEHTDEDARESEESE